MPWAKRITKRIPPQTSPKQTLEMNDYSMGFNSFIGNDAFPVKNGGGNMWRVAKNARITTLGEYGTRRGVDFHSAAAGETQDQAQTSTTGASTVNFNYTNRVAQKFTAGATGRLTKIDLNIQNTLSGTGAVMCEIWTDSASNPGTKLATSSIAASVPTGTLAYQTFYYNEAPSVTSGASYWLVIYAQANATGNYTLSTTTNTTLAKTSVNIGTSWSAETYSINFKQYYATSQPVKGLFRAYKTDGTKVTLFVAGTVLYSVNNSTGALTSVKTGLSASATDYRFALVNDIVYYVNGFDGYRKWDFSSESQVSATNYTTIAEHKGLMFLADKTDPSKVVFSNFAAYETFTSTDFIYVPAPKTGDPVTALVSLNGYLFIYTLNNKYILAGDDRDSFSLGEAPDQRGTFTQESVTKDKNFMYYLSNDGVYRSNGSEAQLLSENVYQEVFDLNDKPECTIQVNGGRLYVWYQTSGSSVNDECLVWNLNYSGKSDTVESRDTQSYGSRAFAAYDDNNALLVGSSLVGQVYWQELPTNDYTNAGGLIEFELSTPYMPFASPAVLKEIRYWNPRFGAQSDSYTIACEYAYDLRDNWELYQAQNVQGEGFTYAGGSTFGSTATYGTTSELQAYLTVPGEYRRIALRYKHYATRQPHTFLGHTLVIQTRRIR
jgi:hypothetical protein